MKKNLFSHKGLIFCIFGIIAIFTSCPNPSGPEPAGPAAPAQPSQHIIHFDADGGTPVPADQTLPDGAKAVRPSDPSKDDFIFLYWQTADGFEFNFSQTAITDDITLKAYYVEDTVELHDLTVNINLAAAGTIIPERRVFREGESVHLTAIPNPGYRFTNWNGDVSKTAATLDLEFAGTDISVTANFEKLYSITDTVTNATIVLNPNKAWYASGETVDVTITPDTGYQFTGWTGNLSGKNKTETLTIGTQNSTIGANIVARWLVLVHLAVDNNIDYTFEDQRGILTNYISSLKAAETADTDDVMDILVMMDGYDTSDPRGNDYETTFTDGYYKISGGDFNDDLKVTTGEINSGLVQTSKNFIDWAYANYQGKRVMYSVFNHGSGFDDPNETATLGIGFDDSNDGDSLSHKELAQVTSYLKTKAGKKIDLMFPYACLMGGVELAWELRDNADYLLSSEEVFPAEFWSYEALSSIVANPGLSSIELGTAFCDNAYAFFSAPAVNRDFTLSLIDLSKMQPLYTALGSLATSLNAYIGSNVTRATEVNTAASTGLWMETPYYTDIGVFMDRLDLYVAATGLGSLTQSVRTALDNAVICNKFFSTAESAGRYDIASGMTIFHNIWQAQYSMHKYNPAIYRSILTFGRDNAWGAYAQTMYSLTPTPPHADIAQDSYEPDGLDNPANNILAQGSANKQLHTFHYIEGDADVDVMRVYLTTGQTYTFATEAGPIGTDTYLVLLNTSGQAIRVNDDISGTNVYSKIVYTATTTGYHYIAVVNNYFAYGNYYVWFGVGNLGPDYGPSFTKWSPAIIRDEMSIK